MATRVLSSTDALRAQVATAGRRVTTLEPRQLVPAARRTLFPPGLSRSEWLGRTVWLPYWLFSDMPAPALPRRDAPVPPAGAAGDHVLRHVNRLILRIWLQRTLQILMRSVWLGLLVGCGWLIVELLGGPELRAWNVIWVTVALAVLGLVLAACSRPSRMQVARMLDASFGLQERIQTAVEHLGRDVPADGAHPPVGYLQIADAANVMTAVHRYPAFRPGLPVRETVLAIACGLLLATLYLIRGASGGLPALGAGEIPRFQPAKERLAAAEQPAAQDPEAPADLPTASEVQEKAEQSSAAREDLSTLADALDDHPTTREAAEAIREGDYERAAQELATAAEQADQLSPAAREQLANDLDMAADAMSGENPNLQQGARDAADGLREGGEPAKDGVRDLSEAVSETGEKVVSQEQLAGEMRDAQAADQQRASEPQEGSEEQSGDPSEGGDPQSGDQQAGEGGDPQEGEPGEGADAAPGESEAEAQEGEPGEQNGEPGEGGEAQDGAEGDRGQQGSEGESAPGNGQDEGGASDAEGGEQGNPTEGEDGGGQDGDSPSGGEGEDAQTGSGAGGGEGAESDSESGAQGGEENATDAEGEALPDPNLTDADGGSDGGDTPGEPEDPRQSITLSRSPDAESYQTSGDTGSASLGSGGGASAGAGETEQGDVGEAGPDANRVPEEYRSIVEDYFTEPE